MRNDGRLCNAHFAHWQVLYPPVASFCAALDETLANRTSGMLLEGDQTHFIETALAVSAAG
jgi:hypothetical protein